MLPLWLPMASCGFLAPFSLLSLPMFCRSFRLPTRSLFGIGVPLVFLGVSSGPPWSPPVSLGSPQSLMAPRRVPSTSLRPPLCMFVVIGFECLLVAVLASPW